MQRLSPVDFLKAYHVFPQTELRAADIGFIFGNRDLCEELAVEAAVLYHQNYFGKIIVTGGVECRCGGIEADVTARALISRGIPANALILERASTHTGENVEFSLPLIRDAFPNTSGLAVIGLGHFAAGPRFMMTFARHAPDITAMHKSVFPQGLDHTNWHGNETLLAKTLEERRKIPDYLQAGFLAPVDIAALNESVRATRRGQEFAPSAPALAFG